MNRTIFSLLLCAAIFQGCFPPEPSEDVNQDRIFTEYDVHYDANSDVTVARASFRFGNAVGTMLELSDSSYVTCNGKVMSKVIQPVTNLTYYEASFAGNVQNASFVFSDDNGKTYQNSASLKPIQFPVTVGPVNNAQSYEMTWTGDKLGAGEEVSVVLFRIENTSLAVFYQKQAGSSSILLTKDQLGSIMPGEITVILERKVINDSPAQAPSAGGKITTRYTPQNRKAMIIAGT